MKTAYYTFTTWDDSAMAAGFGGAGPRRGAMIRQGGAPGRDREPDKVIDLAAWRAAEQDQEAEDLSWEPGEWEGESLDLPQPAPRTRRSRRSMLTAELVSTLSVVAAAVALIIRILTF